MKATQRPRLIFDGVCNLCIGAVRFLYALEKGMIVDYVPYQSLRPETRTRYKLTEDALQGRMYLVKKDGSITSGPFAITEMCRLLAPLKFVCNIFKTQQAQRLYDWLAQRRYRIFGCRTSCYVVSSARN